ncbi:binR-like DNA-invertase [Actinoplanes sp. SE50]|nr:binR-like DNA-invertase [Actinoplanes sp. SE50/110]ATO82624.1 binR-like DNA-invertase [Actinoplanes sp. SE50]SLM00031.1 DNA resolvase domain-containing protein [Actinoplanes sp. SE50/110]
MPASRILLDEPLTGARPRPGLQQALHMVQAGDTLVTPGLARLARSLSDAWSIIEHLAQRRACLSLAGHLHDPADGSLLRDLALFVQFEAELKGLQTREGMVLARREGRVAGREPKLSTEQRAELLRLHASGLHQVTQLARMFGVSRPTVYRLVQRAAELSA